MAWPGFGGLVVASLDATATALLALVAFAVLRVGPRRPENQLFALFLLLVAGNAAASLSLRFAQGDWASFVFADRVGLAFLILDPGVLLYFAAIYGRRARVAQGRALATGLVAWWALMAGLLVLRPDLFIAPPGYPAPIHAMPAGQLLLASMAACYVAAYGLLLAKLRAEASPTLRRQQELLVGAFGIALLYRIGIVPAELTAMPPDVTFLVRGFLGFALAGVGIVLSVRGTSGDVRGALARAHKVTLVGLAVLVAVTWTPLLAEAAGVRGDAANHLVGVAGSGVFALRWVFFALIGGYAILRYQLFDIDLRVQRAAEPAAVAAAVLALVVLALAGGGAVGALTGGLAPGQVILLALAAAMAPWAARAARDRVRRSVPAAASAGGGESPLPRRLEFYEASLEAALASSGGLAAAEQDLAKLRRDLGISEEQHGILLAIARQRGGRAPREAGSADGRLGGRYEVLEVLGEGTHGRCTLARDALLERIVVVKEVAGLGESRKATLREARAAGRLNHPNIVTVHDVIEGRGLSYIVMEHAPRGSLRDKMRAGRASLEEALRLLDDTLAGLEAAHAGGLVHGDVKPENILLSSEGRAKLADFGSAYASAPSTTMSSLPATAGPGTLMYLAPEVVQGSPPSARSDLYAVAVVAYEMLTGEHYFDLRGKGDFEIREAIVRAPPRLPRTDLPVALQGWLERGLVKDAGRRWASAAEMRRGLAAAGQRATEAGRPAPGPVPARAGRRTSGPASRKRG